MATKMVFPIKIKKDTSLRLKKLGTMKDTYDSIINMLIDFYKNNKGGVK